MLARLFSTLSISCALFAGVLLPSVVLLAQPTPTGKTYSDPNIGLKLESPASSPLEIRVTDLDRSMEGTVCEFSSARGAQVSINGALLVHQDFSSLADYARVIEEDYKKARNLQSVTLVREQKLDRRPGQWLMRELEVVDFNTKFRCVHIYIQDDADFYTLMMRHNAREDAKLSLDAINAVLASLTVGNIASDGKPLIGDGDDKARPPQAGVAVAGVVYSSLGNERDIYLLKEGDSKPINLTKSPGLDFQPAFSRDGTKIAFVSGRNALDQGVGRLSGIYTMNADGSDVKWIVKDGLAKNPRWSPDGLQIVYQTGTNSEGNDASGTGSFIFIAKSDGSGKLALVETPGWYCREPDWSPDGSRIVFNGWTGKVGEGGLFTIKTDGTDQQLIVPSIRSDCAARLPRWSPDGKQIIFTGRGAMQGDGMANEHPDPFGATMVCNADGTGLRFEHMSDEARPMFLRNGNKIAFMSHHGGDFIRSGNPLDVFVKNVNSVQTVNLTKDVGGVFDYDISPITSDEPLKPKPIPNDIVFSRLGNATSATSGDGTAPGPSADLFVISEDGKTFSNISQTATYYCRETRPSWSPDKKKIAFESNEPYWVDGERAGRFNSIQNIWVMDADGSNKLNLTRYHGIESHPTWSPDGTTIAFQRGGQLCLIDATGGNFRVVKDAPLNRNGKMTWSNDGTMVVYGGDRGAVGLKSTTVNADPPVTDFIKKATATDPDWNPTSMEVAYWGTNTKGNHALIRFNFPGGMNADVIEQVQGSHPSWAPDGYRIAFDQGETGGGSDILIVDIHKPDPKDLINLTAISNLRGRNLHPDWGAGPHMTPKVATKPDVPAGAKVWVLKGGKVQIKNSWGPELPAGWTASDREVTATFELRTGRIGEEQRMEEHSGKLVFQGPPAQLHEGQEVEMSMTVSGSQRTELMGEWLISGKEGDAVGVDCVSINPMDLTDPRPKAGTIKFKVAKAHYDHMVPSVTLTISKNITIRWEYELKK
jgi:Tol biopolymer transport system component